VEQKTIVAILLYIFAFFLYCAGSYLYFEVERSSLVYFGMVSFIFLGFHLQNLANSVRDGEI